MNHYLVIGLLASGTALLSAWMFLTSNAPVVLKLVLGTASLVLTIFIWLLLPTVMASPVNAYPPTNSPIIGNYLTQDHKTIYIWVVTNDGIRTYAIHNPGGKNGKGKNGQSSEDLANNLAKALQNANPGGMTLEINGNGKPVIVPLSMPRKEGE